jgi:uncharacterized membrane protein
MPEVIFKNSKKLLMTDIYLSIPVAFGVIVLVKALSSLKFHRRQMSWWEVLVYGGVLAAIWVVKAIRDQTIAKVEVDIEEDKVSFVLQRHFRDDSIVHFTLGSVLLDTTIKPSRYTMKNVILKIRDDNKELKISSRNKGLSEKVLTEIVEKLKHYAQQKAISHGKGYEIQ